MAQAPFLQRKKWVVAILTLHRFCSCQCTFNTASCYMLRYARGLDDIADWFKNIIKDVYIISKGIYTIFEGLPTIFIGLSTIFIGLVQSL